MAYSEDLAQRIRDELIALPNVSERKMFGGLAFMVGDHMACGVIGDEIMVRVGPDAYEDALELPGAREMMFTGKPMRGMVSVDSSVLASDLESWVGRGVRFAQSLPPKKPKKPRPPKFPK